VEQYCFNLAKEMKSRGNEVSIFVYQYSKQGSKLQQGTTDMSCDGISLREVYHNYAILKDAEKYEYYNPVIKGYADLYFEEFKPDIVHILHLKNMSTSVIDAAYEKDIPILFTPTDFWMLCPNFTLLRPDYEICRGPSMTTPCDLCLSKTEETLGQKIMGKKHQPFSVQLKDKLVQAFMSTVGRKLVDKLASYLNIKKQWAGIDEQFVRKDFILRKCEKIKKILAPSEFIKEILVENGYEESQIDVLPLGFDIQAPQAVEKSHSDKLRIGYIGTINKHKGVHILIEAIKGIESKNVELMIYGDFTRFHKYTQYIKNLTSHDKRISFKGTFKPEKTQEIFEQIDILAVPSLWYENMPVVIYSALAHNTPVIAPAFGAMPEIIHHTHNGLLFKRNDPDDLREKITDIMADMSILDKFAERITPPKSMSEHADELLTAFEDYTYCDKF
jgi:glycosyltransferase involved in cell wall biosynthesis